MLRTHLPHKFEQLTRRNVVCNGRSRRRIPRRISVRDHSAASRQQPAALVRRVPPRVIHYR